MQGEDRHAAAPAVDDEEGPGVDRQRARSPHLTRAGAESTEAGNGVEPAGAGVEALDETGGDVQEVDVPGRAQGHGAREDHAAEGAGRVAQREVRAGVAG